MESGVEHAHLRDVGQQRLHGVHTLDVGRVVQGSQVVAGGKGFHHFGCEPDRLVELLAAMYHAVTDGIQLAQVPQHGVLACRQYLEDELHALGVFLDGAFHLVLLAVELDGYE